MKKHITMSFVAIIALGAVFVAGTFGISLFSVDAEEYTNTDIALACEDCNLIIISLTNTRKDHLSSYGYERDTTPNIKEFFADSLIFENAFTHASWTLPSATSLFTSLFPFTHGVMQRSEGNVIPETVQTFTEILQDKGYATAAFTGDGDYNERFGLYRGFDVYADRETYDDLDIKVSYLALRNSWYYAGITSVLPSASVWLEENSKKKFFLFAQGFDTHCPFTPQSPFDTKFDEGYESDIDFSKCIRTFDRAEPTIVDGEKVWKVFSARRADLEEDVDFTERDLEKMISLYDGEIAQVDDALASFFELIGDLGLEKNTIILFMSEHGDLFGENGRFMRGGPLRGTFYDPVINFPLLMKHPKVTEEIVIYDLVQMVDLMPTFLQMLGIKDPQKKIRQGKKLDFAVFGDTEINTYVYAGSKYVGNDTYFDGTSTIESIRDKKWKLIKEVVESGDTHIEEYELYDIENDPRESKNLYSSNDVMAEHLTEKLLQWREGLREEIK